MWVYKITHIESGKSYVGKTAHLKRRWAEHRCGKTGGAIAKAIKKYGKQAFSFEVLESDVQSDDELNRLEIQWIERLGSHGSCGGYNLTKGGEGARLTDEQKAAHVAAGRWPKGWTHSDETRAKWSAQRKGVKPSDACVQAIREFAKRPKSEETKRKMSEAAKRRGADPAYREMMAAATKGIPKSDAHKGKLSAAAAERGRDSAGRLK